MPKLEAVIPLSLTTWRFCSMLYSEQMFDGLRKKLGIVHDDDGPVMYPENFWGRTFECFWCLSLWVSLFASTALAGVLSWWEWLPLLWLSTAAGAIMTEKWIGRSKARW